MWGELGFWGRIDEPIGGWIKITCIGDKVVVKYGNT